MEIEKPTTGCVVPDPGKVIFHVPIKRNMLSPANTTRLRSWCELNPKGKISYKKMAAKAQEYISGFCADVKITEGNIKHAYLLIAAKRAPEEKKEKQLEFELKDADSETRPCCGNCQFMRNTLSGKKGMEPICCRNPPVFVYLVGPRFPGVTKNTWCGEYKNKKV